MSLATIACVALGDESYRRGQERLRQSLDDELYDCDFVEREMQAENIGTPLLGMYTAYAAKPYLLQHVLLRDGPRVTILCDASFYAIRPLDPLIEHITRNGYYLCDNGYTVGEWASDRCLAHFGLSRDVAMAMPDCSSYCVGIDRENPTAMELARQWCEHSVEATICGAHTNQGHRRSRNPGFVSGDPRCRGHRHDQTVLSIVAHGLGLLNWTHRPVYTAYKGYEDERTVLVAEGIK